MDRVAVSFITIDRCSVKCAWNFNIRSCNVGNITDCICSAGNVQEIFKIEHEMFTDEVERNYHRNVHRRVYIVGNIKDYRCSTGNVKELLRKRSLSSMKCSQMRLR